MATKKKKPANKKAPKPADVAVEEEIEEEEKSHDVVPAKYRQKYGTAGHCGDDFAEAFKKATGEADDKQQILIEIGLANDVDVADRWGHLQTKSGAPNVGMMRMNLGNVLRGMQKRGTTVKVGDKTFKGIKASK